MAIRNPTHFRARIDGATLAGVVHRPGDVIEIATLAFERDGTLDAILHAVAEAENDYRPLETGVLDAQGDFVVAPARKSEDAAADEPIES